MAEPTESPRRLRRVLIVDDLEALRRLCSLVLERAGYECLEAASGEEALVLLGEGSSPDAVLLDLSLPALSGEATYQEVARLRPALPVIFMTGHDLEPALASPWGVLRKPFDTQALLRAVAVALGES